MRLTGVRIFMDLSKVAVSLPSVNLCIVNHYTFSYSILDGVSQWIRNWVIISHMKIFNLKRISSRNKYHELQVQWHTGTDPISLIPYVEFFLYKEPCLVMRQGQKSFVSRGTWLLMPTESLCWVCACRQVKLRVARLRLYYKRCLNWGYYGFPRYDSRQREYSHMSNSNNSRCTVLGDDRRCQETFLVHL
jgi:hypothetical protein